MNDPHDSASEAQSKCRAVTAGTLFVVPTPIGNLQDMTYRAVTVLKAVSVIACEDTRSSQTLLRHYDIKTPLIAYHDHNGQKVRPDILRRLSAGETVALISDAGTPLIADPGYKLVRAAQEAGFAVVPLPGACAVTTALSASGLPSDAFAFIGFLPPKQAARRQHLERYAGFNGTLIAYETARRLLASLADIEAICPGREVVLARELSKLHEEICRASVERLRNMLAERHSIKGEIVLLIGPPGEVCVSPEQLEALLREALMHHGTKAAAKQVAAQTAQPVSELYQRALGLK